ncbi:magnesium transporter [Saccharibacillus alkalitolerans]|uniref:Magnesium transporter MgtE n=1 Tax=Saccharibacillus alkalitolerans TaxID=2705290 RepID=A0ABX0F1Z1_9BACL|nr:magnesium transporter [Saccharibacillus alkalitolerans]NGZ74552.1 magnesium transporter [Saccharibacillus alkalitolerans]
MPPKIHQTPEERYVEQLAEEVRRLLERQDFSEFQPFTRDLHPYDLSQIYRELAPEERSHFLIRLHTQQLADMAETMTNREQAGIFENLGPDRSIDVMRHMEDSDLARFLHDLPPGKREELLSYMHLSDSSALRTLLGYPPESAGRLMTDRFISLSADDTAREAVEHIRRSASMSDTIGYLYVVDGNRKLAGVVSYHDLFFAEDDQKIETLMKKRVVFATVAMDQEEAARLIQRYELLALPVIDEESRLCGIITVDDILDIVVSEADEDVAKMGGGGKDIDFDTPPLIAVRRRLPWLILLLFIGLVSGSIVDYFEDTLKQIVALAFFMPMIAGMTGNTGTQSLAVVVRGLNGRKLTASTVWKLLRRELLVGLMIGVSCGLLITVIAYFWQGSLLLGGIIGVSLLATLIIGTLTGTCIPLVLSRFKVDPAVASGPLITTLNDILSLFIYFGIASRFLGML